VPPLPTGADNIELHQNMIVEFRKNYAAWAIGSLFACIMCSRHVAAAMRGVHIFQWCACVSGLLVSSPKDGWPGFASACNSSLSNVPNGSRHTCLVLASSVRVGRIGQDRHAGACCNCLANAFSAQARGHSPTLRRGPILSLFQCCEASAIGC
jgi:hypothetical protein